MPAPTSQLTFRGLLLPVRDSAERDARIERRIRNRIERERAREYAGAVRLRLRGRAAAEQLQRELPRAVMKWSLARTLRIVDLIVPEVEPVAGVIFTAHGRCSNRAVVFVHCRIRARKLQRASTVEFKVMGPLP